jgi:hypothetical protein
MTPPEKRIEPVRGRSRLQKNHPAGRDVLVLKSRYILAALGSSRAERFHGIRADDSLLLQ